MFTKRSRKVIMDRRVNGRTFVGSMNEWSVLEDFIYLSASFLLLRVEPDVPLAQTQIGFFSKQTCSDKTEVLKCFP